MIRIECDVVIVKDHESYKMFTQYSTMGHNRAVKLES